MPPTPPQLPSRALADGAAATLPEVTAERDALRQQLDAMRNSEVSAWLAMERTLGAGMGDYEDTLSWKVTKPLRQVRRLQYSIRDTGFASTLRLVVDRAARRNGR